MKILAIGRSVPSRLLHNKDVLGLLEQSCTALNAVDKARYLEISEKTIVKAGGETRYWCADGETPARLTDDAVREALGKSGLKATQIDLVIYCSVTKGVAEPGQSFIVANRNGIRSAICFDVSEACNGFVRALQLTSAMFAQGVVKTAMIVSGEFWMQEKFPVRKNFSPQSLDDFSWCFPAYTFGEMAGAIIVEKADSSWYFDSSTNTDVIKACVMTEKWNREFNGDTFAFSKIDERFICYGKELHDEGKKLIGPMLARLEASGQLKGDECVMTHSSSKFSWDEMLNGSFLSGYERYTAFPKYGNIVTATLPASLYERGPRNKPFLYMSGAAGLSLMCMIGHY